MRVLLLGGTGNLGSRLIPALLAHGHVVVAYVRSTEKLRSLTAPALYEQIIIYEGDALDSAAVEDAFRKHNCDAVMNTAGSVNLSWWEPIQRPLTTSVASAAVRVGKERGAPLRAWFIGGLGSLEYPGTGGWKIHDYLKPRRLTYHHSATEAVLRAVPTADLEWSLLCVAMMKPSSETVGKVASPGHHGLVTAADLPPGWQDHWVRWVPLVGVYLNLVPVIISYGTKLEAVADLLAGEFERTSDTLYVGKLVGMKEEVHSKTG